MKSIQKTLDAEKDLLTSIKSCELWRKSVYETDLSSNSVDLYCADGNLEKALEDAASANLDVKRVFLPNENLEKCTNSALFDTSISVLSDKEIPTSSIDTIIYAGRPKKYLFSSSKLLGRKVCWLNPELVTKTKSKFHDKNIIDKYIDDLLFIWIHLHDTESKSIFSSILQSRLRNNNGYIKISEYKEYLHSEVGPKKDEVVVDAGAHVGKIAVQFARLVGKNGRVHSFEPDGNSFNELLQRSRVKRQIVPHKLGVWEQNCQLKFDTSDMSSASHAISEHGTSVIDVVSLDSFFKSEKITGLPTLIKFDVEGAELEALEGARELIKDKKPRLMISVYHEHDHLWKILKLVLSINPTYRFELGHHNYSHTETDLYCY